MENEKNLTVDEEMVNANETGEGAAERADNQPTTNADEKRYTEAELNERINDIVGKRNARYKARLDKEYAQKMEAYDDLMSVLKAGTKKDKVEEITETFRGFYAKNNVEVPEPKKRAEYSGGDIAVLAKADADEIIRMGYDEVVSEVDRYAALGEQGMSERDKQTFMILAKYRRDAERHSKLSSLGASKDVYESDEFKSFAKKFDKDTPIEEVWDIYGKLQPKKNIENVGSVKNSASNTDKDAVKEFYTPEEAKKFTREDLRKNPALRKKLEESMLKWK